MTTLKEKVAMSIKEELPSFGIAYNFPGDPANANFATSIANACAETAIQAVLDDGAIRGLVALVELVVNEKLVEASRVIKDKAVACLTNFNVLREANHAA